MMFVGPMNSARVHCPPRKSTFMAKKKKKKKTENANANQPDPNAT